ncbi:MAG: XRE family transcriptional regulator [Clostridia bacterium]|nr:XRE family transcriptional regulator [Clostridia bacterium]NCD04042.1 XRE family transcriptional regulator [Clostridia bacterium]
MENENYEQIVANIKMLIEEKGMKQGVVAERAGFTAQDFSNMLNERRKLIRIEHLPAIANAIGVEIKDLFYPPE